MENKIELRKIPCGETFTAFGEEFVVLDHVDGGVLSLGVANWKDAPFDTGVKNNLNEASILKVLGEYVRLMKGRGATDDAFRPMHIDLKATDGTRTYGYCDTDVGLLTLEQYGKYKDIIPFADSSWWLASPWATLWLRSPYSLNASFAWLVYTDGGALSSGCTNTYGIRPALSLNPSLMVSLSGGADSNDDEETKKEAAWSAYHEYLCNWMEENDGADKHYGNSPLGFNEWMEDVYDPDDDEE